jgi:hypothetical protein
MKPHLATARRVAPAFLLAFTLAACAPHVYDLHYDLACTTCGPTADSMLSVAVAPGSGALWLLLENRTNEPLVLDPRLFTASFDGGSMASPIGLHDPNTKVTHSEPGAQATTSDNSAALFGGLVVLASTTTTEIPPSTTTITTTQPFITIAPRARLEYPLRDTIYSGLCERAQPIAATINDRFDPAQMRAANDALAATLGFPAFPPEFTASVVYRRLNETQWRYGTVTAACADVKLIE